MRPETYLFPGTVNHSRAHKPTPDGGILESTQTERAFLAIAQGSVPKAPTVKILEYKDMEPFFVKGRRATSLEQQPTERAKYHNKSVKVEMI